MLSNARIKEECKSWFLKSYSMNLVDDWLTQCIEFVLEDNPVDTFCNVYIHFPILNQQMTFIRRKNHCKNIRALFSTS